MTNDQTLRRDSHIGWTPDRGRDAGHPLPWSPVSMLLSLGRAVLLTRTGPSAALTLPYGFGSVVIEPAVR